MNRNKNINKVISDNAIALQKENERLRRIIKAILDLPKTRHELVYLDRGFGIKTENAIFLEAREAIKLHGKGKDDGMV